MSIMISVGGKIECQKGLGEKVVPIDGALSVRIRDQFGIPSLLFEPPLARKPELVGVKGKATRQGVKFDSNGDFCIKTGDIRIFGNARRVRLKQPDNHLMY